MVRLLFWLTASSSVAALAASVWPGWIDDFVFFGLMTCICWFPVSLIALGFLISILYQRFRREQVTIQERRELMAIPVIGFLTVVLLAGYVPRRIAFWLHRRSFEAALAKVPEVRQRVPKTMSLGIYQIDDCAVDSRGGVYFRVHCGADGIGPDEMSYGFVKHPNTHGTPFGTAKYRVYPLDAEWSWFRVSNDW